MKQALKAKRKVKSRPKLAAQNRPKLVAQSRSKLKASWQLQEAKAKFSDVVKKAASKPQFITVHGKETAVVISYDEYMDMTIPKQSLFDFFQNSPAYGVELELPPRIPEEMREVNF